MTDLRAVPAYFLSDVTHFNQFVLALAAALARVDSTQAFDQTDVAYLEELTSYVSRDAGLELIFYDPVSLTRKLSDVASGPGALPTPPWLPCPVVPDPSVTFTPVANRIYLVPACLNSDEDIEGLRLYISATTPGAANYYVGLYDTAGNLLAVSASTAADSTGWRNTDFDPAVYAGTAGEQLYMAFQANAAGGTFATFPCYPQVIKYVDHAFGLPDPLTALTPVVPAGVLPYGVKSPGLIGVLTGGLY
jgi:hypothetical protein